MPIRPRVAVLLPTYNGVNFIARQIETILEQESCAVDVWVSDDQSTDGTWEWLCEASRTEGRLKLLSRRSSLGGSARNFYRLLQDVVFADYQFVALADQDDIWFKWKLALSIQKLGEHAASAFSSNVIALWPDGRKNLICKSQKQRRLDFLFESAGQGCTYVLAAACAREFQQFLLTRRQEIDAVQFHDWLIYAWCRANGFGWHIEPQPTMLYRQHPANVHGANSGWAALLRRLGQVRSGWYRGEVLKIIRLVEKGNAFSEECSVTARLIEAKTPWSRVVLAAKAPSLRRRFKDRVLLLVACLTGAF
jgi:rhamnosyltransferase